MWLGVDPLWEKYAGMNPYNYCAGNPVMLVDPDGRREEKINLGGPCKKAPHGKVAKSPSKEKFSYNKLYPEFNPNKPIGINTFNVNNPQAKPKELNSILDAHMEIIGGYCLQNEYTKNNLISYLDEVFADMGGLQDIDIVTIHFYEDNEEDVKNKQLFLESVMIEIGLSENQFLITGEQGNNDESDILSVGIFKQSDFKEK